MDVGKQTEIMLIHPDNAPGCYEIRKVGGGGSLLVQTDYDFPSVAQSFGWAGPCGCGWSDGTVDCPECGGTASEFIAAARDFLDDKDGAVADDPGYFL